MLRNWLDWTVLSVILSNCGFNRGHNELTVRNESCVFGLGLTSSWQNVTKGEDEFFLNSFCTMKAVYIVL